MFSSFTHMTRREWLAAGAGAALAGALPAARAQSVELSVFGHRVHQAAATTGAGGDVTAAWRESTKNAVSWVTLGDVNAIHERLLREASLGSTSIDLAYLLNGRAIPRNLALFETLDGFMKEAPIEDFADFAPGLVAPLRSKTGLHGVPVRHAINTIIVNEELFAERGVDPNFKTFEQMTEAMRKMTYKRTDGTQVVGMAFTPVFASNFLTLARCLGGDYMTSDKQIVAGEAPMVQLLTMLADLHKAGAMPRNWATLNNEEITTMMQQGRAAMTVNPYARLASYNDPAKSKFAGKLKPVNPPMAAALAGKMPYASTVEFWSLVIPKNSSRKRVAWDLLRAMSSKASTTSMALNGNGPTRVSSYADARLRANNSFAKEEAIALAGSRIHLPAFDEQARVHDIFVEESQAAVLGMKEPRQAMNDATRRARPLVHLST